MSRLIDTDVFEKFIKEKYKDGESTDDIKDQMLFDLSYQPTAYNVDKVVEQLEEDCFSPDNYPGYAVDVELAIKIVETGGVE